MKDTTLPAGLQSLILGEFRSTFRIVREIKEWIEKMMRRFRFEKPEP